LSPRIQAVAFDLDGVLWDSTASHAAAFETVLRREGIENFDYSRYSGMRTPDVFADVYQRAGQSPSEARIQELSREKSRLAREMIQADAPLAKECRRVLEEIAAGFPVGLASSGSRESVELFLEISGTRGCFRSVLSGNDVANAKPAPEIYERSAAALDSPPEAMLVVEDACAGVTAAKLAGSPVIGFTRDLERGRALREAGALDIVEDLEQVMRWMRGVDG
jgi:beta-phosphoglucomutase